MGKSHLLRAFENSLYQRKSKTRVSFLTADRLVKLVIEADEENSTQELLNYFSTQLDFLLIDDLGWLDNFPNPSKSGQFLLRLLDSTIEKKPNIVLASHSDHLRSGRLLFSELARNVEVIEILPPSEGDRKIVLLSMCRQENLVLPDNIVYTISSRFPENLTVLAAGLLISC